MLWSPCPKQLYHPTSFSSESGDLVRQMPPRGKLSLKMQSFKWLEEVTLSQWFSNFRMQQCHLESLLKHRFLGHTSRTCNSIDLEWGPKNLYFNEFPDDAAADDLGDLTLIITFLGRGMGFSTLRTCWKIKKTIFASAIINNKQSLVNEAPVSFKSHYTLDKKF